MSSTHVPDWAQGLDEAADILANVVTPFFEYCKLSAEAGTMSSTPVVTAHSKPFDKAIPRLKILLGHHSGWYQAGSSGLGSRWTTRLLHEQGNMLDSCFAATTAVLGGKHQNSQYDIGPSHSYVLVLVSTALMSWDPAWPWECLLENQHRLTALDGLLGSVLQVSRGLPGFKACPVRTSQLVSQLASFAHNMLTSIGLLPRHWVHSKLATLPPTLLSHIFNMLDEQLCTLIRHHSKFAHISTIAILAQRMAAALAHDDTSARLILSPALVAFARHALVLCVFKQLPFPAGKEPPPPPRAIAAVSNSALLILFLESTLERTTLDLGVSQQQSTASRSSSRGISSCISSSSSSNSNSSKGSGGSSDLCGKAQKPTLGPTVSEGRYVRALCLCTSDCGDPDADGNCLIANRLLQAVVTSWRSESANNTLTLGAERSWCLLGLLQLLSRQAQRRIQPLAKLRLQRERRLLQHRESSDKDRHLYIKDDLALQSLFFDACSAIIVLIGFGAINRSESQVRAMFPDFPPPDALWKTLVTWTASPGSAATVEAFLRDHRLLGGCMSQEAAANIALMIFDANHDDEHSAFRARISLAGTLRKLMHPASAPMWAAASEAPCTVWGPASKRSPAQSKRNADVVTAIGKLCRRFSLSINSMQDVRPPVSSRESHAVRAECELMLEQMKQLLSILAATRFAATEA
ncbi:MAG: hypothetical protein WDW38_004687 [Sanguina aurantia]